MASRLAFSSIVVDRNTAVDTWEGVGLEVGLLIIVELLIVLVKLAEGFIGAAAFGPIVRAATELGLGIEVTASRELRFVARGTAVLETVLAVLVVGLLLIRVKLLLVALLCDGGGFIVLGRASLGRPPSARSSTSPMDSFRPCSVAAFPRSRRRRKVSSPRGCPCGFFLGDPPATSASPMPPSILATRAGFRRVGTDPKLCETFGPIGALLPCFFSADVALANAPAAPSSPPFVRRDGLMKGGVVGAMMLFYLIWLVHGGFWVKK